MSGRLVLQRGVGAAVGVAMMMSVPAAFAAQQDDLEEIIVVATRAPVSADKVGNSVTVLDAQQIHDSQAVIVSDLLATTPGVVFARNGGPGTTTSVFIRGANSDQTLVLIDGVQLNDPASPGTGFDFGSLLVGDISRIEVLRGSQSTLYGSQAIGGVVNLVTHETTDRLSGSLQGEVGSYDTGLLKGAVGGRSGDAAFRLAAGYYGSGSVSAMTNNTERDPFHNSGVSGRLSYDFAPAVQLDLRGFYTDGKYDYDGAYLPDYTVVNDGVYGKTRQLVGYGGLNFDLFSGVLKNRIAYQYTDTDRGDYYQAPSGAALLQLDSYTGKNTRYEYQGTWQIVDGYQAVFGAQHEQQRMTSAPYSPASASTSDSSAYLQLQAGLFKGFTLTAGERYDDYRSSGSHTTGQFAAAWALATGTVLRASLGQGFKAPSLYQLYSPYGNRDLKPEQSNSWDAGVEQRWGSIMDVSATYFERNSTNLINYVYDYDQGHYQNTARAEARGVELQAGWHPLPTLTLSANYTHMHDTDESPGSAGTPLLRRPDDTANVSLSYTWPVRLKTAVAARYAGRAWDFDYNAYERVQLASYTLVDLRVSYPLLSERLELYGRVENLFDKQYATIYGYGTLGRALYAGVNAKF